MADKTEIILNRQDLVGLVNVRIVFFIDIDVSLARILGNAEAHPEGLVGDEEWKFFFTKLGNTNAPQRRIPCAIFTKFMKFVPHFRIKDALAVKICMDLLKGLRSYGGLKLRVSGSPKFLESLVEPPNVLEMYERAGGHLSPCQIWWVWTSPAAGAARNVEFLFVCLCVRHVCLHVTVYRRTLRSAVVVSA